MKESKQGQETKKTSTIRTINIILIAVLLLFVLSAYIAINRSDKRYEIKEYKTKKTMVKSDNESSTKIDKINEEVKLEHKAVPKKEKQYYHSAESGAIIISQNGSINVKWKKKCNYCGNTDNMTRSSSLTSTLTTTYRCIKCKRQSKVKIVTTRN